MKKKKLVILSGAGISAESGIKTFRDCEDGLWNNYRIENVDDLHERGGSTNVLHLHGEILKARSSNPKYDWAGISPDPKINNFKTYPVGRKGITMNDQADDGFPLRPHIVWFGESVPLIVDAEKIVQECDALIVVGTSLNVYPAAGLVWHASTAPVWLVDPNVDLDSELSFPARIVRARATVGIDIALKQVKKYFEDKENES